MQAVVPWPITRGGKVNLTSPLSEKKENAGPPTEEPVESLEEKDTVTVSYYRGLPVIVVPLPSRRERCRFVLRPISNTVADFIVMIKSEDAGIDRVALYDHSTGVRVSSSTTIEALMEQDFDLVINHKRYFIATPEAEKLSMEHMRTLSDVKNLVSQLYEALNVESHQLEKERYLLEEYEKLNQELLPLEEKRAELAAKAERRTTILTWLGLGYMAVQFGVLARLTWWEYSWDIMEPVTYFVTYTTCMVGYAYFVLSKKEYTYPDAADRQYLQYFHKQARKKGWDVTR
ncbi:unnamed protein product [Cyprideis torosa]|uniref:Calcium uniporter protein n=1 Tax=Cyprideis torosa TaxID=163714 RepID=A0A7R8WB74_9CRUS|nr:unnamed protein product [Cyprideis torosa]CAG0889220.1 unnamed protein product [Cyprideis torosa]